MTAGSGGLPGGGPTGVRQRGVRFFARGQRPPVLYLSLFLMPILPYLDHQPEVGDDVRLADDAFVVGKASLQGPALLESRAVLRGDQNRIVVGPRFRMGRGSSVHVEVHTQTEIGADVWIGDDAVVHASTVGDGT